MSDYGTKWNIYEDYLTHRKTVHKNKTIIQAADSLINLSQNNPSFQENAKRNGEIQGILALRQNSNICKFTLMPDDEMFIGDIVECYNEHWLVIDVYTDEYGITTGEMWLCNHILRFQNNTPEIYAIHCVIEDGSYSKLAEKSIVTADAQYNLYLSLNQFTEKIYIDKRLAVGDAYNQNGEKILQVMKVSWIDRLYQNGGKGNHILKIRLQTDVFDADDDNLEYKVCDYISANKTNTIEPELSIQEEPVIENILTENAMKDDITTSEVTNDEVVNIDVSNDVKAEEIIETIYISGKNTIRIGTTRTYAVKGQIDTNQFTWSADNQFINLIPNGKECKIKVPLDENLVGTKITLNAAQSSEVVYSKVIEVVSIG